MKYTYNADSIRVASDIEQIRDNIHLFAGEQGDKNPNHLLYEVLHNSIDEVSNGFADTIIVDIDKDIIKVYDNGRGIPVDKKDDMYVPYVITTKLASSGKGKSQKNKGYEKPTAGLHGYGLTILNALSDYVKIISFRNNKSYHFELENGNIKFEKPIIKDCTSECKGTLIEFKPSKLYIESTNVDSKELVHKLSAVKWSLGKKLKQLILKINNKTINIPDDYLDTIFGIPSKSFASVKSSHNHEAIELYFTFDYQQLKNLSQKGKTANFRYSGILNSIPIEEGTHIQFGISTFKNVLYSISQKMKYTELTKDDFTKGVRLFVKADIIRKDFNSQDKSKLTTNLKYFKERFSNLENKLVTLITENKELYENVIKPYIEIIHTYKLTQNTKVLTKHSKNTSGKIYRNLGIKSLQDCMSTSKDDTILFIVEGESAGGHLSRIRNIDKHAVYYLTGKPMNVLNFSISKILNNKVIANLIQTIGIGYKYKNQTTNINNLRYEQIVLLSDADPDGFHIRNLLLALFAKLMPDLILNGNIYISEQPLYKVYFDKKKKDFKYVYDINELNTLKDKIFGFKRFKGLGEMEASDLKTTLFDDQYSRYVKVTLSDKNDIEKFLKIMQGGKHETN